MTAIHIKAFRGMVPRLGDRLLGMNFATEALNCKITSGRLDPIRGPLLVHTSLASAIATMYRYRHAGQDNWLVWDKAVDVVRSPTAQDAYGRLYYTGDGEPRMTTFADAISGGGPYPTAFYALGVYIPAQAQMLNMFGGSGTQETRSYIYTFKTRYGEESAPSLPHIGTGFANGTFQLFNMDTAPPNSGNVTAAATVSQGVVEVTLSTARGLTQHEGIIFAGITGMTALNGNHTLLSVTAPNKVTVALSTAQVYAGGGTWARRVPHNTTAMVKRIYRTVGTNTDYKFVTEIPIAQANYDDTLAATLLGAACPTLDSYTPPKNLHSLVALANGALAGIAGNELCLSEQYKGHSWPIANRYAFAGTGVALCAAGNSAIILTDGVPLVATATVPQAASVGKIDGETQAPCLTKRGVVDTGGGCVFPSHDGLYQATPAGCTKVTKNLYSIDEWLALFPDTFKAAYFDQRYYAMHKSPDGQTDKILVLDLAEPDSVTEIDERVDTLYANPLDGKLYMGQANKIMQWDADDTNRYLSFWKSREYQLGAPLNFSVAQVHAEYGQIVPINTAIVDANTALLANADNIEGAIGSTEIGMLPLGATNLLEAGTAKPNRVQFSLIKDGAVVFTKELNSSEPFRLDGDDKTELHTVQIASSIPVYSITVAQGFKELAEVSS